MARQSVSSAGTAARSRLFWMVPVLIVMALIPIRFSIADQLLNPTRVFLLFVTPYLMVQLFSGRFGRLVFTDYAIFFFCLWLVLSVANFSVSRVVGFAGSNVLQILGGYLIGRAGVRSAADFQGLARTLATATLIMLPLAFYEAVLHKDSVILTWLANIDLLRSLPDSKMCCRIGLNRAQVVLVHPIHYGIFASLGLALYYLGLKNHVSEVKRLMVAFLICVAAIFSVSSGPLITMALQILLVGYAIVFYGLDSQWKIATRGALIGFIILELNTTKIAFFTLAEKLAFSAHNAWTRQIMVNTGIDLVKQYPLFGNGLRDWPLPYWMRYSNSIDNYWLVLAGSYGLPTFLAAFSAFVVPLFTAGRKGFRKGSDLYWARLSWSFLMIALLLSLATVHIWDSLVSVIYMTLAAGVFLINATEPEEGEPVPADATPVRQRRNVYTRFPSKSAAQAQS